MARLVSLEAFDAPGSPQADGATEEGASAEIRLESYEHGYAAGWDDALAAQSQDLTRLRTDLGRNLAAMDLTLEDARRHVLVSLEPLLREMVDKVLPDLARHSLGQVILQELMPAAEAAAASPVVLRVAPDNREAVERLISRQTEAPLTVTAEPTLGPGQAFLTCGALDVRIDLDGVVATIATAVDAYFDSMNPEVPR